MTTDNEIYNDADTKSGYADALAAEMDNMERISVTGASKEITSHPSYDPTQKVGPENDFSRDLASGGATRDDSHAGSATHLVDRHVIGHHDVTVDKKLPKSPVVPQRTIDVPSSRIMTSQTLVAQNAVMLVPETAERQCVVLVNRDTTNIMYVGSNRATTIYTGFPVDPGATVTMSVTCELYAICAVGLTALAATIEFLE